MSILYTSLCLYMDKKERGFLFHALSISIYLYMIYSANSFVIRETATANAPGPI